MTPSINQMTGTLPKY